MNTETGRQLAEKRHVFLEVFLKEYEDETGAGSLPGGENN